MINANPIQGKTPSDFSYQRWRETFLRNVLFGVCIFALIALAPTLLKPTEPIYFFIYSVAYAILLVITFIRLPYRLRASIFLIVVYLVGLSALFETAIWGDARVYFLGLVFLSSLLYSPRAGVYAIILITFSTAVVGWLMITGQYQPSNSRVTPGLLIDWLNGGTALFAMGVVMATGLYFFQTEFTRAHEQAGVTFQALQTEHINLESRVAERTQELDRKANQLSASAYIIRQIAEIQEVPLLLAKVVELVSDRFGYYHVAAFLLDEQRRTAFLQAASSETGKRQAERGHQLEAGDRSIIWQVVETARYYMTTEGVRTTSLINDPEYPRTHSELALPLTVRGKVLGVLDIQAEQAQAFNPGDAETLETLCGQIAVSIDNIRLLSETQAILAQLQLLTTQQTRTSWLEYTKQRGPAFQFTPAGIRPLSLEARSKQKEGLQIPLQLRGQEIGSISLQKKMDAKWTEEEREFIEKISTQVSLALENSRLLEETRRRASQEQTVSEISARLNRSLDIETLLQTAARELGSLPHVAEVSVYVGEQNGQEHGTDGR